MLHGEDVLDVLDVKGEVEGSDQEGGTLDEVSPCLDEVVDTWDDGQEKLDASHEVAEIHVLEENLDKEEGDEEGRGPLVGTYLGQEAYEVGVVPLVGTYLGQGACGVGVVLLVGTCLGQGAYEVDVAFCAVNIAA